MRPRPIYRPTRRRAVERIMPASALCAKLGEDFELFSERTEDAVECESLIHGLESIRDADVGAFDIH